MYNIDEQLEIEIQKIYSQMKETHPNTDSITPKSKSKYMSALLHTIGKSAVKMSVAFPNLIREEQLNSYADEYINCFFNYLHISEQKDSSEIIDKVTFYHGWINFINDIKKTKTPFGPLTKKLIDLTHTKVSPDSISPKKERFWKYYIERNLPLSHKTNEAYGQNNTKVPQRKNGVYQHELPFYYILYTIYYYHTSCDIDDDTFYSLGRLFSSYRKWTHINPILMWCISCFGEWYIFSQNKTTECNHASLSSYIPGIATFLKHFGFYWHHGLDYHEHHLSRLFRNYKYTGSKDDICFTFQNPIDFITTHRLQTQHLITDMPLFNKARKDEHQQHMSSKTNYISDKLVEYFHLSRDKFWNHLNFNGSEENLNIIISSSDDSTAENIKTIKIPEITKFVELCAKELFASIFLALSRPENDLLAYIHTQLTFDCIINLLNPKCYFKPFDNTTVIEMYASEEKRARQKLQETFHEALWNLIDNMIKISKLNSSQTIYQHYLEDNFEKVKKMFPFSEDEWLNYINEQYMSSLLNLFEHSKAFEKF